MSSTTHNKRINPKKNKTKKIKDVKDIEERKTIVAEAIHKLQEVHLLAWDNETGTYYSGFPGIEEFVKILREYEKPNILSGFSGVIKVPELKRDIEYILPIQTHIAHGVRLVSTDTKDYAI
jgi:hypothetical protein